MRCHTARSSQGPSTAPLAHSLQLVPALLPCSSRHLTPTHSAVHRAAPATVGRPAAQRRPLLPPCRITNTAAEVYGDLGIRMPGEDHEDTEVEVNMVEVHNPELGDLEGRVKKLYLDELVTDTGVDLEETAYWFHTPPGGWTSRPVKYPAAQEAPVTFPDPQHYAEEGDRVPIEELEEDQVVTGVITDCWWFHGIQVDIGAEFDGLVPIPEDIWPEDGVRETLAPGALVEVRVHRVLPPGLYRWPVQLQLLEPYEIAVKMIDPDEYESPVDHAWCSEQGMTPEDILEATGREYQPTMYYIPTDDAAEMQAMERAMGYDDPERPELALNQHKYYEEAQEMHRGFNDLASGNK